MTESNERFKTSHLTSRDIDISNFGWEMKAGVLSLCIDPGPTGPPALMDVISCRCRAAGKAYAAICSCKKESLSCTIYCLHVNPRTNDAIPTRGRSKWMMRTKTTASRRSMRTTFDLDFDLGSHK